ncbi:hypothetical protein GQ56_0132405 [Burkholderia paludis]|nr:hypothetical protein GQ56_0132405 [Burkholderia paludis]
MPDDYRPTARAVSTRSLHDNVPIATRRPVATRHDVAIATRRPNLRHCLIVAGRHATEDARA